MKNRPKELVDIGEDQSIFDHYQEWLSSHKEPNTVESFKSSATKLKKFVSTEEYTIEEMDEPECLEFLNWLDSRDELCGFTASMYANDLSRMVDYYHTRGYFAYNPLKMALEQYNFSEHTRPGKEKIPITVLRSSIVNTKVPINVVIIVLLLKTGIRRGEAYNLDSRDIHIDNEIGRSRLPQPRREIRNNPDTIFIDSTISEGDEVNGRIRYAGNKPNSTRRIPIDNELKNTLTWWVAMMPPSPNEAEPLLRNHKEHIGKEKGYDGIYQDFVKWGERVGLRGENSEYHIVPHWCRHWFTTKLRESIENDEIPIGTADGYIGGLRGDSASGVIDLYTHDWQEKDWISQVYKDNIPQLFSND